MSIALCARLREVTRASHRAAERSGLMRALLSGRAARSDYARLLRNLHPIYATLERALDRHANLPAVAPIRFPVLYRTQALVEDLETLAGSAWRDAPVSDASAAYADRLDALDRTWATGLAAHAYVRYLGDLSGGRQLREKVQDSFGVTDRAGTAFYAYDPQVDTASIKARFRAGLDALPLTATEAGALAAEANDAFARHIALFEELGERG